MIINNQNAPSSAGQPGYGEPSGSKQVIKILIAIAALLIIAIGGWFIWSKFFNKPVQQNVACTQEAMVCPDGSSVGRTGPNCEFAKCPEAPAKVSDCYISGCSNQICSDQQNVVTTCEYKEGYACYKLTTCAKQADGKCGWTPTLEFNSCFMGK